MRYLIRDRELEADKMARLMSKLREKDESIINLMQNEKKMQSQM